MSDFDDGQELEREQEKEQELDHALHFGDQGEWDEMAGYLREMLERHPDDPTVLCWLGVAERELGMEGVAYERFRACAAAGPEDPQILAVAGSGLARFDDPAAESTLRTAALLGVDVAFARTMYGAYLAREGLFEEAMVELSAALALAPDDPETVTEWGVALALGGRPDEAVEAFSRAGDLDPEDGWPRSLAGLVLVSRGRTEDAIGDLLAAADLRPDDVELALLTALAAAASGEEGKAFELVERARFGSGPGELPLVEEVSDRVEEGDEACKTLLEEELITGALRERLMTRP